MEAERDSQGLVLSVMHLPPGSQLDAVYLPNVIEDDMDNPDPDWRPPIGRWPAPACEDERAWLVFSDKHKHVNAVVNGLMLRYPGEVMVG